MRDPRLNKLADVVVHHCTGVKPGDLVTIVCDPAAMPGVEALFEAVLRAGGHPSYHAKPESLQEILLRLGSEEQLRHVSPFEEHRLAECDVLIVLQHHVNSKCLSGIDPARAAIAQAARRGLITMSLRRAAEGSVRYCLSEIPGNSAAQSAGMSLNDYSDWVFRAGFLHLPDPLGAWRTLQEQQARVCEYLQARRVLRFRAPARTGGGAAHDGTDLTVDVSGSTWINCAGGENFPDGEVFSGPRGVDGVVNFTHPAVYRGQEVEGVRLKFVGGRVVEASAARNEEYLIRMLDMDAGARAAGEVALGTNYAITEFTRNTFFDEKIGGTFHVALGAGYPQSGNTNESGLHWDMVCDLRPGAAFPGSPGGTVHADGELFHKDGRFVFAGWPGA